MRNNGKGYSNIKEEDFIVGEDAATVYSEIFETNQRRSLGDQDHLFLQRSGNFTVTE